VSTSDYFLYIGLFVFILATQLGRREPNAQRLILPVVIVAAVGYKHLSGLPSGGTAQLLVGGGVGAGLLFGLTSLLVIRIEKNPTTGRLVTIAGWAYAMLWTAALVARLGFAYGSTHWFRAELGSFSLEHHVPGSTYGDAFVLWVLVMIIVRTLWVVGRGKTIGAKIDFSEFGRHRGSSVAQRVRG
jgi:hypothetical protein